MKNYHFKILGISVGHTNTENFVALNINLENIISESDLDKFIEQTLIIGQLIPFLPRSSDHT